MAYYRDLTPYEYDSNLQPFAEVASPEARQAIQALLAAVNVGWLTRWRWFRRGRTSAEFRTELFRRCRHPEWKHRGFHLCTMGWCSGRVQSPVREKQGDEEVALGAGVIIVRGPDRTYAAPDLIYHYVRKHFYRPPDEFIQAVLETRQPV